MRIQWRATLPRKSYTILRVDGRSFHTLTRHMSRPFDGPFMDAMDQAAVALCQEVQGCQFAYVQSDEISLLATDFGSMQEPWFGGVVQKVCSVASCVASNAFNTRIPALGVNRLAEFDARVFTVPSREEAINYFLWRQADCHRNAVSMAAEAVFSSKQLLGKPVSERLDMLGANGIDFRNAYPARARLGGVAVKVAEVGEVTYTRKDTLETFTEVVTRHRWEVAPSPWFDWDAAGFLETNVPRQEAG